LLGRHEHKPKLLHRELARNPVFFSDVIAVVYRPADEESREVTDEERARANLGHKLLASWRTPPGTLEGGTIDAGALKTWVRTAREALAAKRLSESGDRRIGETLSGSPIGADGIWPHPAVREVIEETASEDIEHGLELGLYNSRGVTSRSLTEGGAQEQQLFDRYTGFATAMRDQWPRTTAMLRRIAERYRRDARREDQRAELREDLND
jgi:hypothetical protein